MKQKLGRCKVTGKQQHKSMGAADAHIRAMFKRNGGQDLQDKEKLNSYWCKFCGFWEVGRGRYRGPVQVIPVLPKLRRGPGLKYKKD